MSFTTPSASCVGGRHFTTAGYTGPFFPKKAQAESALRQKQAPAPMKSATAPAGGGVKRCLARDPSRPRYGIHGMASRMLWAIVVSGPASAPSAAILMLPPEEIAP